MAASRDDTKTLPTYWQILNTSKELFAKHGFRDTTIRMIAEKANVNSASINYYFRSKAALYEATFYEAFEQIGKPMTGVVGTVVDQKTWEAAIDTWVVFMLNLFLKDDPQISTIRMLVARERSMPTEFCLELFNDFFNPVVKTLRDLVKMAMPDAAEEVLQCTFVSCLSQCTCFMHRDPPWDKIVVCKNVTRSRWIQMMRKQIVGNITARLAFKTNQIL